MEGVGNYNCKTYLINKETEKERTHRNVNNGGFEIGNKQSKVNIFHYPSLILNSCKNKYLPGYGNTSQNRF